MHRPSTELHQTRQAVLEHVHDGAGAGRAGQREVLRWGAGGRDGVHGRRGCDQEGCDVTGLGEPGQGQG